MGAFQQVHPHAIYSHRCPLSLDTQEEELAELFATQHYVRFLKAAIQAKKNILISGGTSTGKTTFLNACLKEIPLDERIITLEDVREVDIPHPNKVHLLASKGEQGLAKITV